MKRSGTEYAELFAENFSEFRDSGDALILCDYLGKLTESEISGEPIFTAANREEIDCLLYEVTPGNIDLERYRQADKIIGFPWCNITDDPLVNSIFKERVSGKKWLVIGILSDDPIKAFSQVACIRFYDDTPIAIEARGNISTISNVTAFAVQLDMNFFARSNSGVVPYSLTDSYGPVPLTDFGPPIEVTANKVDQRVRITYEASMQVVATGASGGDADFILQRSMQPNGDPEVWGNLSGQSAPRTLAVDQTDRYTISFTDTLPDGIPSGIVLKYRLIAKRVSATYGVTVHNDGSNDLPPSVSISADWLYLQGEEGNAEGLQITASSVTGSAETINGFAEVTETSASTVTGEASKLGESASGSESTGSIVTGSAEAMSDTAEATETSASAVTGGASKLDGSASGSESTGSIVTGSAEALDPLWSAPPSDPNANELGLTPEVIEGTTVTIPSRDAGYPNVRFVYHASLSLLATGVNGGKATLQLQKSEDGGAFTDVTDEFAVIELTNQDDEIRATFDLQDAYPAGVPADIELQYRLTGKSESSLLTVNVHDSLIDPDNTAPSCSVEADYFFG